MNTANTTVLLKKATRALKKASPTILTCAGIGGVIGSYYLLWKSTKKHKETAEAVEASLEEIRDKNPEIKAIDPENDTTIVVRNPDVPENYTKKDYQKELAVGYLKAAGTYVKLYGPTALVATASLASIGAGFGILRGRNAAYVAACAAAERTLNTYRSRVIQELGKDADRKFRFGIKDEYVEVPVVDKNGEQKVDKEGNPKTKVEKLAVVDDLPNGYSEYARVFDESCSEFQHGDPEYNKAVLQAREKYLNELIHARARSNGGIGVVTLNEAYAELGFQKTKAGQIVGWVYFDDPKKAIGDNYISFGVFDVFNHVDTKEKSEFINGYRSSVILDFNVDGNILDYI